MRKMFLFLIMFLAAVLISACGGGTTPTYCDPNTLAAPMLSLPVDGGTFIPGSDHLQWYYPDGSCEVEGYRAEVSPYSDFSADVLGASTTWPNSVGWPLPISPGTTYYWRVRPFVGSVDGPWSVVWSFNGISACAAADLVAPEPVFPLTGQEFWYDAPSYQWGYTGVNCEPEGYHLQVATDAAFGSIVLDKQEYDPSKLWTPTEPYLTDCTIFYWRVAAMEGGVDGPFSDVNSYYVNTAGACPSIPCPMAGLSAPESEDPSGYEIVSSLTPTLTWDYPEYCDPDGYALRIGSDIDLSSEPLQGGVGLVDNWTTPALEPATQYWWDVAAIVPPALGPFSQHQTFFTGPECASSADMGVPELIYPINGDQVHSEYAWLHYSANAFGCIPDGYAADLQTDSAFGGTNLLGTYMFPATNIITDPLEDCTTYYWRIAAIQDSVTGPYSVTGEFFTNYSGTCMQPFLPPLSVIAIRDLACMAGPGYSYEILGYLVTGEESPIHAQNLGETYWVVDNPDTVAGLCWVLQEGVEPTGDTGEVGYWSDDELLEGDDKPESPSCRRDMNRSQCNAADGTYHAESPAAGAWCECP